MSYTKIRNTEQLKELAVEEELECFIWLNGGLRSSKRVLWDDDLQIFYIVNEIDDSQQQLTEEELSTKSNIGLAIQNGAFFKY